MRKIGLVIKREYLTRVRTKGFLFGTVVVPLILIAMIVIPALIASRQSDRSMKLAIVDGTGNLAAAIVQGLGEKLPNGDPAYRVVRRVDPVAPDEENRWREELRRQVNHGDLDGFLLIPSKALQGEPAAFYTRNMGDFRLSTAVRHALDDAATVSRLKARGLEVENVRNLLGGIKLTLIKVTQDGEVVERGQTVALSIVLMLFLYMTIFVYGLATMQSVQEEKNTRVVEILASSIRPTHLLWGKMLGVGAVGFTQLTVWMGSGALLGAYGATAAAAIRPGLTLPRISLPGLVLLLIAIFFITGYFLYASLYAAIGAMVSSTEEAQQVATPINILLGFSPIMLGLVLRDPNSPTAVALSMIPFFSPVHMVLRITIQMPPLWQILLSLLIITLTTSGIVYVSARIYRVGILMYGKRPSLRELVRWLRYN